MNRLNRKVEYALMALKIMAGKPGGELTSAKEVVERVGCPFDATARVLQQLVQANVLRSEQGASGGYTLKRDLLDLSLFDLMEAVLGPVPVAKCLHDEDVCDLRNTCNITSPIADLNKRLSEMYQSIAVGELLHTKRLVPSLKAVPAAGHR